MLHIWVVVCVSIKRWALSVGVPLALGVSSCYNWDATDRPLTGVNVTTPSSADTKAGSTFVFSGSVVANVPSALAFGIKYQPWAYEEYVSSSFSSIDSVRRLLLEPTSTLVTDSIQIPETLLPGRYKAFSVLTDSKGQVSDTNMLFKRIIDTVNFPRVIPGGTATYTEVPTQVAAGTRVAIYFSCRDISALDSLVARLCLVLDSGRTTCKNIYAKAKAGKTSIDTAIAELPTTAVPTQRYSLQLRVKNIQGNAYIWKPLFQIK